MTPVHCEADMPEIERLRARVAELEARSAKLRAARERVAPLETVDCHCCHRVRPGYPGFDRCAECAESLGEDQIAAMFREARERVAELEAAAAERAAADASADQTYRDALAGCLTGAPPCGHEASGHWCWPCVHALNGSPREAERRAASLRADVRAISESIDTDAARAEPQVVPPRAPAPVRRPGACFSRPGWWQTLCGCDAANQGFGWTSDPDLVGCARCRWLVELGAHGARLQNEVLVPARQREAVKVARKEFAP